MHGSRRSGLSSSLFTADADGDEIRQGRYVYKGGNSTESSPSSRSNASAPNTDVKRIDMSEITSILVELRKYANHKISDLPPKIGNNLRDFVDITKLVSNTKFYYELAKTTEKLFGDIKHISPNTVAAYFRGCFVHNNFDGPASCSATCAGMMPPPNDIKGWSFCEDNVLHFDGVKLEFQHVASPKSNRAIIHVIDYDRYDGFKDDHVQQLLDEGIEFVSLYIVQDDGKYIHKLNSQPVNHLLGVVRRERSSSGSSSRGSRGAASGAASRATTAGSGDDDLVDDTPLMGNPGLGGDLVSGVCSKGGKDKRRDGRHRDGNHKREEGRSSMWGAIIFFVIVIIIAIIIWYCCNRNKTQKMDMSESNIGFNPSSQASMTNFRL